MMGTGIPVPNRPSGWSDPRVVLQAQLMYESIRFGVASHWDSADLEIQELEEGEDDPRVDAPNFEGAVANKILGHFGKKAEGGARRLAEGGEP